MSPEFDSELSMVKYSAGRLRSWLPFVRYDFTPVELYETFQGIEEDLEEISPEMESRSSFLASGTETLDGPQELVGRDSYDLGWGRGFYRSDEFDGVIQYLPFSAEHNAVMEADFDIIADQRDAVESVLEEYGFRDPIVPRVYK